MPRLPGQSCERLVNAPAVVGTFSGPLQPSPPARYSRSLTDIPERPCRGPRRGRPAEASAALPVPGTRHHTPTGHVESLISRSVSGLTPRRLAMSNRPARSSATACRVRARFAPPSGTNRATAFSCRVMTTSSPRTTRSSNSPNRVFAWNAVTVAIIFYRIDQSLTSLTRADRPGNSNSFARVGGSYGNWESAEDHGRPMSSGKESPIVPAA